MRGWKESDRDPYGKENLKHISDLWKIIEMERNLDIQWLSTPFPGQLVH